MSKTRKGRKKTSRPGVVVRQIGFEGADHAKFKAAVLASAQQKVDEAHSVLSGIKSLFARCDPLQILATCASYGLQGTVTEQGLEQRPLDSGLEQYQVELLQAVLLTMPRAEWGDLPAIPDDVQIAFDKVRELASTFLASRLIAHQETTDEQEIAAQSIAEHIRLHTQVVRNWAYFRDVVSISTELYSPLDRFIEEKASFSATDIIRIGAFLSSEWEGRLNRRFQKLRKIARQKSARQVLRTYFKEVPELFGTPEEVLAILPKELNRFDAFKFVLSHYDVRLAEMPAFELREIAEGSGVDEAATAAALRFLSLLPGALEEHLFDHVHLDNPVARAPIIQLSKTLFFAPMPQVIFTNIHAIIRGLCDEYEESERLERIRSSYLETKVIEVLRGAFPQAQLAANACWTREGSNYETDLILQVDEVVLIVEVKSHQLTGPALRGAAKRLKRHVSDLILNPSIQSLRLQETIELARQGDATCLGICKSLGINAATIRRVLRLSVSLEDFSILSSSEVELRRAGWLPSDHRLAPLVSVADLLYLTDILAPPYLIHYLVQRERIQSGFDLTSDEMDLLGVYLETLLNIGSPDETSGRVVFTGMSAALDHYYMSRDAGVKVSKPAPRVVPYFRKLVDRIYERSRAGWSTFCVQVLDAASPDEQRKIVNAMERLKGSVRKRFREKGHLCLIQIIPPQAQRAGLIFYLYPDAAKGDRKTTMQQLAAEFFESSGRQSATVIGHGIDRWHEPYDVIAIFEDLES